MCSTLRTAPARFRSGRTIFRRRAPVRNRATKCGRSTEACTNIHRAPERVGEESSSFLNFAAPHRPCHFPHLPLRTCRGLVPGAKRRAAGPLAFGQNEIPLKKHTNSNTSRNRPEGREWLRPALTFAYGVERVPRAGAWRN